MEYRHLKAFIALSERTNFSRAAESLYISQSALSKRIAEMEDEFGTPLFDRGKQSVSLTKAGQDLLPRVMTAVSAFEDLSLSDDGLAASRRTIHTGISPQILELPSVLTAYLDSSHIFSDTRKKVGLQADLSLLSDVRRSILSNAMDLAITFSHDIPNMSPVSTELLFEIPMCIVTGKNSYVELPRTAAEITNFLQKKTVYVYTDRMRGMMHLYMILSQLGVNSSSVKRVDDRHLARLNVMLGNGVVFLPKGLLINDYTHPPIRDYISVIDIPVSSAKTYALLAWDDTDPDVVLFSQILRQAIIRAKPWHFWGQEHPFLSPPAPSPTP